MGAVESLIGVLRRAWFQIGKGQRMTDESFLTVAAEIESIINSRPLTLVSDDPADPRPLTPFDFLLMSGESAAAPGFFDEADAFRRRWKQTQFVTQQFWRRFQIEYFATLHRRTKWLRPRRDLALGDFVMIVDSQLPRGQWLVGVVSQVKTGSDGHVRTCEIRTSAKANVWRSISKVVLLEAVN